MLKSIRLPSLVSTIILVVCLLAPAMMGANQVAAQGIRIQIGGRSSGYYSGYGRGYYGYGSGYGIRTGYASPYTGYGYSSGYTGYGYGVYGHRSPSYHTYPRTNIYNYGYGTSPYLYYPTSNQFHGRALGHNYNHSRVYNPYYPYGFRSH